ncbi:hypothetical protein ABE65_006305 [Fictibacillus phosphorivorans]|uniref:DUF4830 domain-containing protein n=1 Tax=Fictibacillus phosphorivorans TaxID=1221500 RepID=A0A160ILZ4_9BACL|nr:hypothetical protein [Fictibacillus phosphorivorans]ANC76432.1 hypothetical protein ABE65_006305 [Fictibacillus phosphorivorans]
MFIFSYVLIFTILNIIAVTRTPEKHTEWLEKNGWEIDTYFPLKQAFASPIYSESLDTYRLADVHTKGFKKGNVDQYTYRLKGDCGNHYLEAVLLTHYEEIIGSYIRLSESNPGVIKMMNQPVFMKQICQRQ